MPRAGLTRDRVVDLALELAVEGGAITLGSVAARAGVRTPSLYKHVASAADLDSLVAERVLASLADAVDGALGRRRGIGAAAATLGAYRDFATANPNLFALLPVQPGNDPRLRPLGRRLMARIATAIGFAGLDAAALHALRLIRSAADGFVRLELAGGFGEPADVEASWRRLRDVIAAAAVPA